MNERRIDLKTCEQYNILEVVFWRLNIREMLAAKSYQWKLFATLKASLPSKFTEKSECKFCLHLVRIINFELNQRPNCRWTFATYTIIPPPPLCTKYIFQHERNIKVLLPHNVLIFFFNHLFFKFCLTSSQSFRLAVVCQSQLCYWGSVLLLTEAPTRRKAECNEEITLLLQ